MPNSQARFFPSFRVGQPLRNTAVPSRANGPSISELMRYPHAKGQIYGSFGLKARGVPGSVARMQRIPQIMGKSRLLSLIRATRPVSSASGRP